MANVNVTTGAALLPKRWSASIRLDATEEMVVASNFNEGEGVEKMLGGLYVRRVAAIAAAVANADGTPVTYTANTEQAILISPVWAIAGVQIARSVYNQMDQSPENPYRKQLALGVAAYVDQQAAVLAASFATNQAGNGSANIDYTTMLDIVWKIGQASMNHWQPGKTPMWMTIHPTQGKYLGSQMNLIADYIRGDGETPVATGWVLKATGCNMKESGNVYQAGGLTYNIVHTADACVLAYNEQPTVLPPQEFDASTKIICTTEFGVKTIYDAYAGVLLTPA